ncbi:MAG TPA: DUF3788 family protein [Chitinispirillaceae bacterium]|nr:DUF3788 family protein [Chitinispirillaceae bacterium]
MKIEKQLIDPNIYPDENVLSDLLGEGYSAFCELEDLYRRNEIEYGWRYYKDGKMWLCKAVKKKKTIAWMSGNIGFIRATIYIPEKYIEDIYNLKMSEATIEMIRNTKNTGKSKGCTFEIRTNKILKDYNEVMQYKMLIK